MGYLCVYNVREDTFSRVVKMKDDEDINSMAISSDETHIIISKGLDSVVLVDIANLNEMRTLEGKLQHFAIFRWTSTFIRNFSGFSAELGKTQRMFYHHLDDLSIWYRRYTWISPMIVFKGYHWT